MLRKCNLIQYKTLKTLTMFSPNTVMAKATYWSDPVRTNYITKYFILTTVGNVIPIMLSTKYCLKEMTNHDIFCAIYVAVLHVKRGNHSIPLCFCRYAISPFLHKRPQSGGFHVACNKSRSVRCKYTSERFSGFSSGIKRFPSKLRSPFKPIHGGRY